MSSVINNEAPALQDKRVAFVGKLGGVTRREAQQVVRDHGGVPVSKCSAGVDLIVIGADELPLAEDGEMLGAEIRNAAGDGRLEIISETQLWQRLGIVEAEQNVRRLYTPAMLADLLGVTVAIVRRWHRRGLIVPAREVQRLPYFDFQEIATAQRLAQLVAAGASPASIEAKLAELSRYVPDVDRPMAQLSVIVEGKQILLRQGEGLVEPGGQRRIDFEALEVVDNGTFDSAKDSTARATLSLAKHLAEVSEQMTTDEMIEAAITYEDEGSLESAVEMYRAALTAGGARAEVCFHLAELLYLLGDISAARERYFMAIELDENFVEARANLGCVLAELSEPELAIAAFQGALAHHPDYPDVHYHLARTLDDLNRMDEADSHWDAFLKLAPDSPWAEEARDRLE
jgi:tetratricopeptide (TPR) repeat protein